MRSYQKVITGTVFLLCLVWVAAAKAEQKPDIRFDGVEKTLESNLALGLSLSLEGCNSPAWRIRRLFKKSDQELKRAAQALGYYHLTIEKRLTFSANCWKAEYHLQPGQPLRITNTDIRISGEGNQDKVLKRLITDSQVKPGEVLHHGRYEKLKEALEVNATERGYLDNRFLEKKIRVDVKRQKAIISLHLDTGKRYRIGKLRVHQDTYDQPLIDALVPLKPGAYYSTKQLITLQQSLQNSGFFEQIRVTPDLKTAKNGLIDIDVDLQPVKRSAYKLGIGAATDTGPRMVLGYERRRINSRGHRIDVNAEIASKAAQLSGEYAIPIINSRFNRLSFRSGYQREESDSHTSSSGSIGASLQGVRWGWRETSTIDWVTERYTIGSTTDQSTLLVPGITWSRTWPKDPIRPKQGYRMSLSLKGTHDLLLSDTSFFQTTFSGKWITPVKQGRLLLRGELGALISDNFSTLPASYRYYAGGDQSIRGFDYQSLGPTNSEGEVIGGRYLLTSSIEYEHPIREKWSVAIFADAGNAIDGWNDGLKVSLGTGLRWQSPIGPIRLDLAFPMNSDDNAFKLHLSMGPDL